MTTDQPALADSPPATIKPIESGIARQSPLNIRLKARIRSLYLVHGLPPKEIAQSLKLKPYTVTNYLNREGLAHTRRTLAKNNAEALAKAETETAREIAKGIASESTELALKSLDVTRQGLDQGGITGAKQAALGSQAARNLVAIARDVLRSESANAGSPPSINLFFLSQPVAEPKQAEPIPV